MERMFRLASPADLAALRDLERTANLAGLGHVFPPERYPFPDDAVLARWALVLDEPGVDVLVLDGERGLTAYVAYDETTLRHLAVHPGHWGSGIATAAITACLDVMEARGGTEASLWCLEENLRARRLYEHLGWRATTDRDQAPWPPHPVEMRYVRSVGAA
jgi:GNAT superfamily N-acetyltransferase